MAVMDARRCRSFVACPQQASLYYGTPFDDKALCASFYEAKALYANPRLMKIDTPESTSHLTALFDQHRKALYKVQSSRSKRLKCEEYAQRLAKCMRNKGL